MIEIDDSKVLNRSDSAHAESIQDTIIDDTS